MQSEIFGTEKNSTINVNSNSSNGIGNDAGLSPAQQENGENYEDLENFSTDSDDGDQFINNSFSSPSNSGDEEYAYRYAYRGSLGINFMENNNVHNNHYPINPPHNNNNNNNNINNNIQQEDDETDDFLEMDFEPDNSEIENDNYELRNGHDNSHPVENLHIHQLQMAQDINLRSINQSLNEHQNHHNSNLRSTGAKPKQFSTSRNLKSPKQNSHNQISDGDNTFKITGHLYSNSESCSSHNKDEDYNVGASCSRYSLNSERPYHRSNNQLEAGHFLKPHKSPSKSSSHNHKQQRLNKEEQNDQFLFEIEPIKPRNSVTIYTSNCDEKILMDALTSLKLKPDREIILNYFNKSKISLELGLIDYIIYRSKKNCNYLKLIEIIEESCMSDFHDEYGTKRFDINFYPLDFFSTTPEMIDIEVSEIIKRWSPQTDLGPLINIKNKYFIQTNVLGKLVNIIRRLNNNQRSSSNIFRDDETIKIPQFYVSGYITITMRHPT